MGYITTESGNIIEKYVGQKSIDKTENQKYLGFTISDKGRLQK